MSLRDTIADAADLAVELLDVAEWGGVKLELRQFDVETRSDLFASMTEAGEPASLKSFHPAVLVAGCFNPETGEPVFVPSDVAMLRGKSGRTVENIAAKILALNGMDEEAVDRGKDVSSKTPSDGSGSGSLGLES